MLDGWQIEITEQPDRVADQVLDEGLEIFNNQAAELAAGAPLRCYARTPSGELAGGVIARTWGACCEVQIVWVNEKHRRRGVATELLRMVENAARSRGCRLVYLETFSFQAPSLYERADYKVATTFSGFPAGIRKFIMQKQLG